MNREEKNRKQREYRARIADSCTKKYEKMFKGRLMRTYRNIQSRVSGIQKSKSHLYEGIPILQKEDFYAWATQSPEYARLYEEWVESGYSRKLSPSIDRIDSSKGYVHGNMQWLTHSENSRRGAHSRFSSEVFA